MSRKGRERVELGALERGLDLPNFRPQFRERFLDRLSYPDVLTTFIFFYEFLYNRNSRIKVERNFVVINDTTNVTHRLPYYTPIVDFNDFAQEHDRRFTIHVSRDAIGVKTQQGGICAG